MLAESVWSAEFVRSASGVEAEIAEGRWKWAYSVASALSLITLRVTASAGENVAFAGHEENSIVGSMPLAAADLLALLKPGAVVGILSGSL